MADADLSNLNDRRLVDRPLVVLVHGAWHGAWCWSALQAALDRHGVASYAIDLPGHGVSTLPLGDLVGDAAHVSQVLDQLVESHGRPVLLVGHSYGGAVITQAAAGRTDIAHLMYVAAFALDDGESVMSVASSGDHKIKLGAAIVPSEDGMNLLLDPMSAVPALYGECSNEAIAAALPRLCPQPVATFDQAVSGDPRSAVASSYVICARDEAVHPAHQRLMAGRCGSAIELDTDHSPFVSSTEALADHVISVVADALTIA